MSKLAERIGRLVFTGPKECTDDWIVPGNRPDIDAWTSEAGADHAGRRDETKLPVAADGTIVQMLAFDVTDHVRSRAALKNRYRDWRRREVSEPVRFMHLDAMKDLLESRVASCAGYFMAPSLLDSQFVALERLDQFAWDQEIGIARPNATVIDQSEYGIKETLV